MIVHRVPYHTYITYKATPASQPTYQDEALLGRPCHGPGERLRLSPPLCSTSFLSFFQLVWESRVVVAIEGEGRGGA